MRRTDAPTLIERDDELALLRAATDRLTRRRRGGAVAIEADAAGLGRTALVDAAAGLATAAGACVRRVAPGPLERDLPYGAVRALLEPALLRAPAGERARLTAGGAGEAGRLLAGGRVPEGVSAAAMGHSLLWLCAGLTDGRPLVLVVDDAQWADGPSLEALTYLARRAGDLPLLVLVTWRGGDPLAPAGRLALLADACAGGLLAPAPLSAAGSARLLRRLAPDAPPAVRRQAAAEAAGAPWLLVALGRRLDGDGGAALRAAVRRRLARLDDRGRAEAAAAAAMGASPVDDAVLREALALPVGEDGSRFVGDLAALRFDAGHDDGRTLLLDVLGRARSPAERAALLTPLAAFAVADGDATAGELVAAELAAAGPDRDTRRALQAAALDVLVAAPERHAERAQLVFDFDPGSDALAQRLLLAARAWVATELGTLDAARCAALARAALADDLLLGDARRRSAFGLAVGILVMTGDEAGARGAIDRLRAGPASGSSRRLRAATHRWSADLALRGGELGTAEAQARRALDLGAAGALDVLVTALAERGAVEEARALLGRREPADAGILHARARVGLAEGDLDAAHADALAAGRQRDREGRPNPTWTPWRSTAALALAHSGRREEALVLAEAELALAEAYGAPAAIVTALHARATAEPDPARCLAWCEQALAVAERSLARLETARVHALQGATLRRLGRRVDARDPLRRALAAADALGAALLADQCRRELVASGLRPRRAQVVGAAALTPRQREICDLAAAGVPNRAIAERLFLSVKTVETHLAAAYRKLGVATREALDDALVAGASH